MFVHKKRLLIGGWLCFLAVRWVLDLQPMMFITFASARSSSRAGKGSTGLTGTSHRSRADKASKQTTHDGESPRRSAAQQAGRKSSNTQSSSTKHKNSRRGQVEQDEESEGNNDDRHRKRNKVEYEQDDESPVDDDMGFVEDLEEEEDDDGDDQDDIDDDFSPRRRNVDRRESRTDRMQRPEKPTDRREKLSRSSKTSSGRRVVPYTRPSPPNPATLAFTRGIAAIRESIPDASALRETALSTLNAAKETTGVITANIYREVKGLTSSELEQVMLKATRPDDSPAKGKHVERLVGVTYQISARYDIYDAVLRKLWSKMCEKDWRTTIKALYVLHRFSADGAPDHQPALKARLRELRRTKDPKRKEKYFNSKLLLAGDTTPSTMAYREFLARYAHYVLLRAQCFGGTFSEMSIAPDSPSNSVSKHDSAVKAKNKKNTASSSSSSQPKSSAESSTILTALRSEHLDASQMLLKAAVVCALKGDEECENTAICVERVVADLIALTAAVAKALNAAISTSDMASLDPNLLKRWCQFYSNDLLPQTKFMMKKMSPILDTYGLFLPSRIGVSVSPDLLEKGLALVGVDEDNSEGPKHDSSTTPSTEPGMKAGDDKGSNQEPRDSVDNKEVEYDETDGLDLDEVAVHDDSNANDDVERCSNPATVSGEIDQSNEDEYEYYDEEDYDEE